MEQGTFIQATLPTCIAIGNESGLGMLTSAAITYFYDL